MTLFGTERPLFAPPPPAPTHAHLDCFGVETLCRCLPLLKDSVDLLLRLSILHAGMRWTWPKTEKV
jgi:hypothetical protein